MKNNTIKLPIILSIIILAASNNSMADDDSFFSRFFSSESSSKHPYKRFMTAVNNPTYKEECGSCHFAYLPELLPEKSWGKVMANLNNHFGEDASLDKNTASQIEKYLKNNSADKSGAKRSVKFMRSLNSYNDSPIRIQDIPYMKKEHNEISVKRVKSDPKIKSMSNCVACHKNAEQGNFDDD